MNHHTPAIFKRLQLRYHYTDPRRPDHLLEDLGGAVIALVVILILFFFLPLR